MNRMDDLISRQAAIDAIENAFDRETILNRFVRKIAISAVRKLPSAQPEQLEQCPIYGGMCAYPSDQCYDCPRHAGARMEVTT